MTGSLHTEDLRRSVRHDVGSSARTGAPPLGHLSGLHRTASDSHSFVLAFDLDRPALIGGPGLLEVTMLADLALGGAIRNYVGLATPMPTLSMSILLAQGRAQDVAWANGECTTTVAGAATSRSRLYTSTGEVVGDAQGLFALPALPYEGPGRPMPWDTDRPPVESVPDGEEPLGEKELFVDQIAEHAASAPSRAWGLAYAEAQMTMIGEKPAMTPTALMVNRLGHVQGGSLLTAAVLAASAERGVPVRALVSTTIEFIDAATVDEPVVSVVNIHRTSRRSLFASVTLVQDGRTCCHVTTIFRH